MLTEIQKEALLEVLNLLDKANAKQQEALGKVDPDLCYEMHNEIEDLIYMVEVALGKYKD